MIALDYTNLFTDRVGEEGIPEERFEEALDAYAWVPERVQTERAEGGHAHLALPSHTEMADRIATFARERLREGPADLVVLGIGGSALGTTALFQALRHPRHNLLDPAERSGPRLFVLDNVDPEFVHGVLDLLDPERTLVNVVSKSGETTETLALFLIFHDWFRRHGQLGREAERFVFTTGSGNGTLQKVAAEHRIPLFEIPAGVGGRFSVLSPVGLLPAALLGIEIHDLLAGAQLAYSRVLEPPERDPAFVYALAGYLLAERVANPKRSAVVMPYADGLQGIVDWYRQLLAESLGKRCDRKGRVRPVGPTPVRALGATDQHSQLQLYVEGPCDKWVTFIEVARFRRDLDLPPYGGEVEGLAHLANRTLGELIGMEKRATELALTEAGRPNATLRISAIEPLVVGELLGTLLLSVTYAGFLYDVDPYDQPGVEAGKRATYAQLGKPGYEEEAKRLAAMRAEGGRRVAGGGR